MNNIFVTLFDSGYLSRGLTMYESLRQQCEDFRLYVIAFDGPTYEKLNELALANVILISLEEFEDEELLSVKGQRSRGEYCWTSTPKAVLYVFDHYQEKICTYIDADMMFFADPGVLTDELGGADVLITEHRYSDYCDQTKTSGKYCVQFMPFRNNENGRKILNWWKDRCLDACRIDKELGICGDQTYLDEWCSSFDGVHELQHLGGGVAPWNVNQYTFFEENGQVKMRKRCDVAENDVIFYHFHSLVFYDKGVVRLTGREYIIPDTGLVWIYKPFFALHELVCKKYGLKKETWCNIQHFRDDDVDGLKHEHNYYLINLFL